MWTSVSGRSIHIPTYENTLWIGMLLSTMIYYSMDLYGRFLNIKNQICGKVCVICTNKDINTKLGINTSIRFCIIRFTNEISSDKLVVILI